MKKIFSQINLQWIGLAIILLLLTLPSRLYENDRVINIDEPWWVISSSNFYYAVTHKDFANTYFEYHPGVTNMWIISTAMHIYFPEYRGFGQGFFDQRKPFYEEFLRENNKEALDLVRISRYIQAGVLALLSIGVFYLLTLVVGERTAFLTVGLVSISPFFLGHSRLLNMETMGSLFVLLSLMGMYIYMHHQRRFFFLVISGGAFGLAQLNKSTSIALLGIIGLMLIIDLFKSSAEPWGRRISLQMQSFGVWFMVAAITYFMLWPGMWVDPLRMLQEVYGNAFSYAFQGSRLDVVDTLDPQSFNLVTKWDGVFLYIKYWLSASTWVTWIGILFALVFLPSKKEVRPLIGYLALLGLGFMFMFGIAQGRNHAHYIMNTFVAFDVIAGLGWGSVLLWTQSYWQKQNNLYLPYAISITIILAQIGMGLPYAPYYFNYESALTKNPATYGYGEGMDLAADYLNQKPESHKLRAYVYNGMGTFSYYFSGETVMLKRAHLFDGSFQEIAREIQQADYLVMYPVTRTWQIESEQIFNELEGNVLPEKKFSLHGREYIYIYAVKDIPQTVLEAIAAKQTSSP